MQKLFDDHRDDHGLYNEIIIKDSVIRQFHWFQGKLPRRTDNIK